jgi:hypothetical protein
MTDVLFVLKIFNDAVFKVGLYVVWNESQDGLEWLVVTYLEKCGCGDFKSSIPAFAWRYKRKPRKVSWIWQPETQLRF